MMNRQISKKEIHQSNPSDKPTGISNTPIFLKNRNPSKVKETPKASHSPIIHSSKAINVKKSVFQSQNKSEVPLTTSEMINKFSDDRYREIKDINNFDKNERNERRQPQLQRNSDKNLLNLNMNRPSTPKVKQTGSSKINNFMKEKKGNNLHNVNRSHLNKKSLTRDQAAKIIQRKFRNYLKKIRNDPKYEMANLLKKKKLSILKSYNIIDSGMSKEDLLRDEFLNSQNYAERIQNQSRDHNHVSKSPLLSNRKSTLKDEDKMTANFGKNVFHNINNISSEENSKIMSEKNFEHDSKLTSLKDDKNFQKFQNSSQFKDKKTIVDAHPEPEADNFIDDYESFLSYKKYSNEMKVEVPEENLSIISNNKDPHRDNKLEKLKKSLDHYSHISTDKNKNYSEKQNITPVRVEASQSQSQSAVLNISTHKDQTGITKQDISDTVNVYEKIFKEIKKENTQLINTKINSSNFLSITEIKQTQTQDKVTEETYNNDNITPDYTSKLKLEELDSHIENIDKNISKINNKYNDKSSIVNFKSDKESDLNTNININKADLSEISGEKKKMVERLNQMLETEEIKNNIHSKLSSSNTDINININMSNISEARFKPENNKETIQTKLNNIHSILDDNTYLKEIPSNRIDLTSNTNINTAEILNMQLELKESRRTIETMKDIIEELRREMKSKEESFKKELQEKSSVQKYEFDNIIQRQNGLIESLISEKKKLTSSIDELTEKLDGLEKINHKKIQQLVENFDLELKKNKDAWYQAEKMRRKKWEDQKIKEIKETTVKGLEPEIERILSSHKQEMSKMEDRLNEDLRRQRDKLNADYERRFQENKERFVKEKEEALEHERSLNTQRIRNQNERLEEEYNEERRRWNAHFTAEIQRMESIREKDKKLYEDQIIKIEERNIKLLEEKENYYKLKISEMEKRFEDRIKDENETYKIRFEKDKNSFIEQKNKEFEQKIKETKNELLKDRDKQIQIIIEKLGEETIAERKKIQVDCERKADEINKSLKIENESMKQKIQDLSDKLAAESKVRLMLDDNLDTLSRKLQDKEREICKKEKQLLELNASNNEINNKYSSIVKDFNSEKLDIELDYKAKLQKADSDYRLLSEKLDSLKGYYESKIADIQTQHKSEIMDIEEKILKSLNRKDDIIKKIQEESQYKDITIQKYEEMLAKQRKEFLIGGNK
jgi:hypothetical protein